MNGSVFVAFACNDEHGNVRGRVDSFDISEWDIKLSGHEIAYQEWGLYSKVQVGRRRFTHHGMKQWTGNMAWNGADMDIDEARRLVAYLLERGWDAESWPTEGAFADLFADADKREGK